MKKPRRSRRRKPATLTPRQTEVWALVAEGCSNKEICKTLGICMGTVKAHLVRVFDVIGARNRTEAALQYLANKGSR